MADFNIRSESIDVEQIMRQIRSRIQREARRGLHGGTNSGARVGAAREVSRPEEPPIRLDRAVPPKSTDPPDELGPIHPPYEFSDQTLFTSHRGLLRFIRRLLNPVLKLFFNPNTLNQVLHAQSQFNSRHAPTRPGGRGERNDWQTLYYEVLHNLVLETTRSGIELRNMKMRLEALSSRLEFSERRVRALEGVVQYRPEVVRVRATAIASETGRAACERQAPGDQRGASTIPPRRDVAGGWRTGVGRPGRVNTSADPGARRRRRRRRGRRGPGLAPVGPAGPESSAAAVGEQPADIISGDDDSRIAGEPDFDNGDEDEAPTEDV